MTKYEQVLNYIDQLDNNELIALHNEYCSVYNGDDYIYSMFDFDEIMSGLTPIEIAQRIYFGDFNPNRDYFWFNGYGNLVSSDYIDEMPIYTSDIARNITENNNGLGDDGIWNILADDEDE